MRGEPRYRADIDALRAIAVVAVIVFHVSPGFLPGGFLGVDVFFVISGFVITRLLLAQLAAGEPLSALVATFYRRRVLRIMPLFVVVVVLCLIVGWFVLLPDDLVRTARVASAGSLVHANQVFADTRGYFEPVSELEPLLHTWSLSIEEQFYLLWPLALAGLYRAASPRARLVTTIVVTVLFVAISQALVGTGTGRPAYFLLRARAYEPLLGCCCAMLVTNHGSARARGVLAVLGLAGMAASFVLVDARSDLPGVTTLLPTCSTALVIWAGAGWLAARPVVWVGRISYSLYLVHWPVLCFLRYLGVAIEGLLALGVIAAIVALSVATHRFVEERFRHRAWSATRAIITFAVVPAAVLLVVRASIADLAPPLTPLARERIASQRVFAHEVRRGCHDVEAPPARCRLGVGPVTAVLWGDSHANHYTGLLDVRGQARGEGIRERTTNSCPPLFDAADLSAACRARNAAVLDDIVRDRGVRTVYLAAAWSQHPAAALATTVGLLRGAGKQVVLLREMPELPLEQLDCPVKAAQHPWLGLTCTFPDPRPGRDRALDAVVIALGLATLDPPSLACNGHTCNQLLDGVPLYRLGDRGHLNDVGARALGRALGD
jgi:peptidoglycan/LPS O-acetylase OafA/YrhL